MASSPLPRTLQPSGGSEPAEGERHARPLSQDVFAVVPARLRRQDERDDRSPEDLDPGERRPDGRRRGRRTASIFSR